MTLQGVLLAVLLLVASAACGVLIWALRELVGMSRSVKLLSDDVHSRLVPLLDKLDVTVDAANAELLRIDGAITRLEDASVRVSAVSGTFSDIVQAPVGVVSGVAEKVRRAWKDRHRGASAPQDEEARA